MTTAADPNKLGGTGAVAVLTVNWNRPALTLACLQGLRKTHGVRWHLFIVDNASSDDSVAQLSGLGDDVTLIQSEVNGGWSGANNRAARTALAAGFDHLFFLNNDAEVGPGTLAVLLEAFACLGTPYPVLGAIQTSERGPEGAWYGSHRRPRIPFPDDLTPSEYSTKPDLFATDFIKGAALFAHRAHFDRIGYFDERFFLNFEETDWCARARAAGFPVLMVKAAQVVHSGSGTMGGLSSPISTYFLVRNGLLYSELRHGPWVYLKGVKERMTWIKFRYNTGSWTRAVACLARDRSPWAIAYRRGFLDYALRRFGDCPTIIRDLTYSAKLAGRS